MSLNFDVTKVSGYAQKYPEVVEDGVAMWNPATNGLVWAMFAVGIQRVDARSKVELTRRIVAYNMIEPLLATKEGPLTPAQVAEIVDGHMGMTTNISQVTVNKFYNLLGEAAVRKAKRQLDLAASMEQKLGVKDEVMRE